MIKIKLHFSVSDAASRLSSSITHGTREAIERINQSLAADDHVVDLSIGTLDEPTDRSIDQGVIQFIQEQSEVIHAFAPVKGFPFLRKEISDRVNRLHNVSYNPDNELIVTPGGIKGAITVVLHTLLNPGDEVIIPIPNWPHYADMIKLHHAVPKFVKPQKFPKTALSSAELTAAISEKTKLIILGDCINPTGKVYSNNELIEIAAVIAKHNIAREKNRTSPIFVLLDCPYEAHILNARPKNFSTIEIDLPNYGLCFMRDYTLMVTGPGKTYGMHGDRIGYVCAPSYLIDYAEKVQVNLNSFASTYSQVAAYYALQKSMDSISTARAVNARKNLDYVYGSLSNIRSISIDYPSGGYFIFANFSKISNRYQQKGYLSADKWLLHEARVATIGGQHFTNGCSDDMGLSHFVRINCGRNIDVLKQAIKRINKAIAETA